MLRNKKGKFISKKSFLRQFRAKETHNLRQSVTVESQELHDHTYCKHDENSVFFEDQRYICATYTIDTREDNSTNEWRSGRRVVELDVLAKLMYCVVCRTPLHLSNTEGEKRYGLASTLYIRCMNCHVLNDVHTGKKSQRSFDINLKLALGK